MFDDHEVRTIDEACIRADSNGKCVHIVLLPRSPQSEHHGVTPKE